MKQHDDYISGPHHYWTHFVCGFLFGGGLGARAAYGVFDSRLIVFAAALTTALAFASSCGRWGERSWRSILDWLHTWWRAL